jgi:hypothetical protein
MARNPNASVQKTIQTPIKNTQKSSAIIRATSCLIICIIATPVIGIEQIRRIRNVRN